VEVGDRVSDNETFFQLADPYRSELLVHCYRMLGSLDDAEDLVQETYLRAWRGYDGFEGRSSLRAWLYRIATMACLTALQHRSRRFLPSGLGPPSDDPDQPAVLAAGNVQWLQPLPGSAWAESAQDPATIVTSRSSVRLALIAALQHLPPRQRVVLILRDVLAWRAAEVADLLGTSATAVNSALRRARAQLDAVAPTENDAVQPLDRAHQELLDRYVRAFENADVEALLHLLRADVTLEMPPESTWFAGRHAVGRFIATRIFPFAGPLRLLATVANDQPAVAAYRRDRGDGSFHPYVLQVLTLGTDQIARIVVFRQPMPFPAFGLPVRLDTSSTAVTG
jgi:RNA polymerase sigma-70 factor (ECF subfamily)